LPRVLEDPLADQRVVQHEVRGAQPRDRGSCQQPGIARPSADQRHMPFYNHESSGPLSQGMRSATAVAVQLSAPITPSAERFSRAASYHAFNARSNLGLRSPPRTAPPPPSNPPHRAR